MDAEYRQAIHEAAQRVTMYLFDLPEAIPIEIRGDMLTLAAFGQAKCMACQIRPVSELGAVCTSCSPEPTSTVTVCNGRTCNHRKYSTAALSHCGRMSCPNYSEKCDAHKIGGSSNVD
jgi:hypothetical protein